MSPIDNGVGHSEQTPDKQAALARILGLEMKLWRYIQPKPYNRAAPWFHYIDTNAGSGINPEEECIGSPLVFLQTAQATETPYRAWFIECNEDNAISLAGHLANLGLPKSEGNSYATELGDNKACLIHILDKQIPDTLPRGSKPFGVIYHDPNGVADFDLLAQASTRPIASKMDIIIRYAGSAVKRCEHMTGRKLLDYLSLIHKKEWLVRRLQPGDKWQWTFLLGCNWANFPELKSAGFVKTTSEEGQSIIEKLHYTNGQLKERQQPQLLEYANYAEYRSLPEFQAVRTEVWKRDRGICQTCGAPARDVHHLRYPKPWGALDVPENMVCLCHECHCKVHNKEN